MLGLMAAPERQSSARMLGERAVQVGAGLVVHGDAVGAGLGERLEVAVGIGDHQVQLEREVGHASQRPHGVGAEGEVRHEDAIHHIDVQPFGTTALERGDGVGEVPEVGGQHARGQRDGAVTGVPAWSGASRHHAKPAGSDRISPMWRSPCW